MIMAGKNKELTAVELCAFCSQIAMILKAGISVQEGIAIMAEDSQNAGGADILETVRAHAEMGEPFRECLQAAGVFPKYMLDMVLIGEQSGRLDEVMDSLAAYYENSEAVSKSLRSAVTYPVIMIVMMVAVICILVTKVLPIFNEVFSQLGSQLSPFSQSILQFGTAMNRYSVAIVAVLAVVIIAMLVIKASPKGREWYGRMFRSFFGTRRLAEKISAGRFASAMALMLSSGLDVDQSLEMAGQLVDDRQTRSKVSKCQEQIADGGSFADALAQAGLFSGVYARMVLVGFKTGAVDVVMRKIADSCEAEVDDQISRIISILEPTLVAVLSLIVGMILLSVMLPLMGIMSSIG